MSLRLLTDLVNLKKRLDEMQKHYDGEITSLRKELDALKPKKPGRPKNASPE